ncbi:MAG: hypothetical protein ABIY62_02515 [Ginsengibacter sp.]
MKPDRPLSPLMLKSLYECYLREAEGRPSNPFSTNNCKGLVQRKLIEIRPYSNGSKLKDALYLTKLGKETIEPVLKKIFN